MRAWEHTHTLKHNRLLQRDSVSLNFIDVVRHAAVAEVYPMDLILILHPKPKEPYNPNSLINY